MSAVEKAIPEHNLESYSPKVKPMIVRMIEELKNSMKAREGFV